MLSYGMRAAQRRDRGLIYPSPASLGQTRQPRRRLYPPRLESFVVADFQIGNRAAPLPHPSASLVVLSESFAVQGA